MRQPALTAPTAAIDRAKRNALRAGAMVDFRIADATRLDHQANLSSEVLANMPRLCGRRPIAERRAPAEPASRERPLLENHLLHMPLWAVAAARLD
jgi:hypothetical protein